MEIEIEQQIVVGGLSSRIRRRALRDPAYTLPQMLLDGRREEMRSFQTRDIESQETPAAVVHPLKSVNKASKHCYTCGGNTLTKGNVLRKASNAEVAVDKVILLSSAEVTQATQIAEVTEADHVERTNPNFAH